ncbi:MAG TPA: LptF/LptG family permease, partial [Gammaproteobacteria bacterium]|nr:LptF/LptG family permease [Gammaproteobacteria bacterium]
MNLLSRHLIDIYLRAFGLCMVGALILLFVVEFFSRIGDFASYDSAPSLVAAYFALKVPKWMVEVFPAASLLAVMLGIGSLVRSNEVQALQACGVSIARIGRPLLLTSVVLSSLAMAWNEIVVPPTAARARVIKDIDIKGLATRGMLDATSLWLQVPEGFLNIDYFDATNNVLDGVTLHGVDARFRLSSLIEIPGATWKNDHWEYEGGTVREFAPDGTFTYSPLG